MKLREDEVTVDGEIGTTVVRPAGDDAWPGVLFSTDIFQRTESTLRTARRLAAHGFVVAVPDIYPHGGLGGVALEFDDEGKARGQAGADGTTTAQFDADIAAVLGYLGARPDVAGLRAVGFCIGGHLTFRAALDPRVQASVCFYPTGLQDGKLGADRADSLARAGEIQGRLMIVFGSRDPHVPAEGRLSVISQLHAAGLTDTELHVYAGGEHAFMRDVGARYDPALTDQALTEAVAFLQRR